MNARRNDAGPGVYPRPESGAMERTQRNIFRSGQDDAAEWSLPAAMAPARAPPGSATGVNSGRADDPALQPSPSWP